MSDEVEDLLLAMGQIHVLGNSVTNYGSLASGVFHIFENSALDTTTRFRHHPPRMNVLILAAGYATALYPLTQTKAKPLLTVAGKPMMEWVIDNLARSKASEKSTS